MSEALTMDKIVSLCRRRGFVFPSSEIYGGLGSSYDYGHYGVLLKENVKARWLEAMVRERDDIVALDSAIILHPRSGRRQARRGLADPLVDCKFCKQRRGGSPGCASVDNVRAASGETDLRVTEARQFNLMLKRGSTGRGDGKAVYPGRRPRRWDSSTQERRPTGAAAAASDRTGGHRSATITPQLHLQTLEFEQMEMSSSQDEAEQWYRYWIDERPARYTCSAPERHRGRTTPTSSHYSPAPATSSTSSDADGRSRRDRQSG
jgi:glycyl-tRNA synthetase